MNIVKYYIDYDGIAILKCPKCGSYNIKDNFDDGVISSYYRCVDCNFKAKINFEKEVIIDAVEDMSKFRITIDYDIVDEVLRFHKIDENDNKLPIEVVEEMLEIKEKVKNERYS